MGISKQSINQSPFIYVLKQANTWLIIAWKRVVYIQGCHQLPLARCRGRQRRPRSYRISSLKMGYGWVGNRGEIHDKFKTQVAATKFDWELTKHGLSGSN